MSHLLKIKLQVEHSFIKINLKWLWGPGKIPSIIIIIIISLMFRSWGAAQGLWGLREALHEKLGPDWAGVLWYSQEIMDPFKLQGEKTWISGLLCLLSLESFFFGRFMRECAADFLGNGQELGTNPCPSLDLGSWKTLQITLGDSLTIFAFLVWVKHFLQSWICIR